MQYQILALLVLHAAVDVAIERDERFGESVRRLDGRVMPDAVQRPDDVAAPAYPAQNMVPLR